MGLRVVVTGPTDFYDWRRVERLLNYLHQAFGVDVLIEGEAAGLDRISRQWAEYNGVPFLPFPADWAHKHRAAGPQRNQQMIDEGKPDVGLVFLPYPDRGTEDMRARLIKAGIPFYEAGPEPEPDMIRWFWDQPTEDVEWQSNL